ncbi:MAG TPA: hypothetical protein VK176_13295 [Phycisphaerales bacterium]|nr:hypothetical protein [Phycisphaerales bacterium]
MTISSLSKFQGPRRGVAFMLALGALAGVLLWAKLRLVSNMPRSVYAQPRQTEHPKPALHTQPGEEAPTPEEIFERTQPDVQTSTPGSSPSDHAQPSEEPGVMEQRGEGEAPR